MANPVVETEPVAEALPARLPRLTQVSGVSTPAAPVKAGDLDVEPQIVSDLALKLAYTVPSFTTEWVARHLHLPQPVAGELLEQQRVDHLLDVQGQAGPFGYRYAITSRGRERAGRLLEISGYIGPAPVSLASYASLLDWQMARFSRVTPEKVTNALAEMVLTPEADQLAGLAVSSGRSLFLFGPPGNGKTTLGRLLHDSLEGDLWVPYAISLESSIIRVFDPQVHEPAATANEQPWLSDQRWIRIRRPLIVVGGETTLESFDLIYSPALRYYEAPMHFKANGGTFLIDDFGRQRVDPHELLNRWIIPLEHQVDYLALHTGQKIQVPFHLMLIVATNLALEAVTDPAFLRRMGYRLHLGKPSEEQYSQIFQRYAARQGATVPPALLPHVLDRYAAQQRELRCCEPRDLIERVRDICRFRAIPLELNEELLNLAWMGYFGNQPAT
jgi:predicted ATPase with chaperone activity